MLKRYILKLILAELKELKITIKNHNDKSWLRITYKGKEILNTEILLLS